jgi:hypothetical protein
MNVLILGGESPRHKAWVRQVAEAVASQFGTVAYLDYKHWDTGEPTDIEHEIQAAANIAKDLGEYIVIAKSIGTVITTLGNARGVLHPKRCVFLGLPLGAARRIDGVVPGMKLLPATVFIQNSHDPLGSADEVKSFISLYGNDSALCLATAGDTHDYADFTLIRDRALGSS